jgi:peptidoglycan hydrolase-like protein with peptidoglycan-binding domain
MDMDRYYHGPKGIARTLFGGHMTKAQVAGVERIIAAGNKYGYGVPEATDYWLATSYHETGKRMQPVRESYGRSTTDTINKLEKAYKAGKLPWVKTPYWRGGWFGRGDVQLTHEENYKGPLRNAVMAEFGEGCDIHADPDLALRPDVSAFILVEGTSKGHTNRSDFTRYSLETFINTGAVDFVNARKTVNPGEKPSYRLVAGYAEKFRAARLDAQGIPVPTTPPKIVAGPSPIDPVISIIHAAAPALANATVNVYGPELYDGSVHEEVRQVQQGLVRAGYPEVGEPDGKWGTKTRGMVLTFRADRGLPIVPTIDDQLLAELTRPGARPGLDERGKKTAHELKDKPVIKEARTGITGAKIITIASGLVGGGQGISTLTDHLDQLREGVEKAQALYDVTKSILPYVAVVAVALGAWYFLHNIIKRQVENYRTARLS